MKRLLLYTHYNFKNQLSEYVLYQVGQLAPLFERIIFISNSPLNSADLGKIFALDSKIDIIQRENKGYDFSAWQQGLDYLGWEVIEQFDSLTLMNDTCFGPFYDFYPIYDRFEAKGIDFWGMTLHPEAQLTRKIKVKRHLQSYFLVFHRPVLQSTVFRDFWENIQLLNDVQQVIIQYEATLTSFLEEAGFVYDYLLKEEMSLNVAIERPDVVLAHQLPLLKIKAFKHRPEYNRYLFEEISSRTNYPMGLLVDALSQRYPAPLKGILPHLLVPEDANSRELIIHFHLYSIDYLEDIFSILSRVSIKNLVMTYASSIPKSQLEQLVKKFNIDQIQLVISNTDDFQSLLAVSDYFSEKDDIIHLHNRIQSDNKLKIKFDLQFYIESFLNSHLNIPKTDYGMILPITVSEDFIEKRLKLLESSRLKELSGQFYPLIRENLFEMPLNEFSFFIIQNKRIKEMQQMNLKIIQSELLPLQLWILGYNTLFIRANNGQIDLFRTHFMSTYKKSWLLNPKLIVSDFSYKDILVYYKNGLSLLWHYVIKLMK